MGSSFLPRCHKMHPTGKRSKEEPEVNNNVNYTSFSSVISLDSAKKYLSCSTLVADGKVLQKIFKHTELLTILVTITLVSLSIEAPNFLDFTLFHPGNSLAGLVFG